MPPILSDLIQRAPQLRPTAVEGHVLFMRYPSYAHSPKTDVVDIDRPTSTMSV